MRGKNIPGLIFLVTTFFACSWMGIAVANHSLYHFDWFDRVFMGGVFGGYFGATVGVLIVVGEHVKKGIGVWTGLIGLVIGTLGANWFLSRPAYPSLVYVAAILLLCPLVFSVSALLPPAVIIMWRASHNSKK